MLSYIKHQTGNVTIAMIMSAFALIGTIAVPILWIGDVKEASAVQNAVQDTRLNALDKNYESLNAKMDALLIRNGINPLTVKQTNEKNN